MSNSQAETEQEGPSHPPQHLVVGPASYTTRDFCGAVASAVRVRPFPPRSMALADVSRDVSLNLSDPGEKGQEAFYPGWDFSFCRREALTQLGRKQPGERRSLLLGCEKLSYNIETIPNNDNFWPKPLPV